MPIKQSHDLQKLPETIVAEIKLNRKKLFFVLSYRHPNVSNNEVVTYMNRLGEIYDSIRKKNPYVTIFCGEFSARSPAFWEGDSENYEGRLINDLLTYGGSQSCIDLTCTDQPFTFLVTGILPSLGP